MKRRYMKIGSGKAGYSALARAVLSLAEKDKDERFLQSVWADNLRELAEIGEEMERGKENYLNRGKFVE